jgi:acyl-CoA reductase-like NAD-dependent aldehyde dehydrogenase
VDGTNGTFATENPANNEHLADITNCGQVEVDAAVAAATHAFYEGEWSQLGGYERGQLLNKLADAIERDAEEIAMLEVLDNGKTLGEATGVSILP